ncbi:MAG: hypothetical protein M3R17_05955 [Bacteroidota bacterium]|nr:hypothetical protein [Bacteroidota bacterium]
MKKQGNKIPDGGNKLNGEENLPGYPHYPDNEDIMNTSKATLSIDIENPEAPLVTDTAPQIQDEEFEEGTDADVNADDLEALGADPTGLDRGEALIIPGAELDDAQEEIGSEDEENNYYSKADN